jgi:hypothetical protein
MAKFIKFGNNLVRNSSSLMTFADGPSLVVTYLYTNTYDYRPNNPLDITVQLYNYGTMSGSGTFDWEMNDTGNTMITNDSVSTGTILSSAGADVVVNNTSPSTTGQYYIRARMNTSSIWVNSTRFTVTVIPYATSGSGNLTLEGGSTVTIYMSSYVMIYIIPDRNDIPDGTTYQLWYEIFRIPAGGSIEVITPQPGGVTFAALSENHAASSASYPISGYQITDDIQVVIYSSEPV